MNLAFDVYAKTLTGARLVRLTNQQLLDGSFFRVEWQGTGSGQVVLAADQSEIAYLQKNRFVLVTDLDLGGSGEIVGGFFLGEGEFVTLSAKEGGGRIFKIGGPGALSYLHRAEWWKDSFSGGFDNPSYVPRDDGYWHWFNDQYGDIMKRALFEAQHASRPFHPIPKLTYDWTSTLDSNGDAWSSFAGEYSIRVGYNLISTLVDFIRLGLFVDMDVSTIAGPELRLNMHLYQNDPGRDLSSASFAAGKVRFQAAVNILADLTRAVQPNLEAATTLVLGKNTALGAVVEVDSGSYDVVREEALEYGQSDDAAVLTDAGEAYLAALAVQTDTATFPHPPAGYSGFSAHQVFSPGRPGGAGDYWVGDTVTLHTGTGQWDYNEQAIRVAAINWKLDPKNGQWWPQPELGSTYGGFPTGDQVPGNGAPGTVGCTCPLPAPACLTGLSATLFAGDYRGCTLPTVDGGRPCTGIGGSQTWAPTVSNDPMGVGLASCAGGLSHDSGSQAFAVTPGDSITAVAGVARYNDFASIVIRFFDSGCAYMSGQDLASDAVALDYFSFTDVTVSGTVPVGATAASVILKTGAFGSGVGLTGALGYYSVTAGRTDDLCGNGAFDGTNIVTYGSDYIPGSGGQYIPAGSQLPAPHADVIPIADAGGYFTDGFVEGALQELGGAPTRTRTLTNKSGASVAAGDVVVLDTANNDAFTTTTTAAETRVIGVAQEAIANNAAGLVALEGYVALVNVSASVTRGHYGSTSTTAKKASGSASRAGGAFCQFAKGGTTPDAILFGVPDTANATPSGAAGGDLSGSYPNPTVAKINGVALTGTPSAGQVPTATSGTAATWQTPAGPTAAQVRDAGRWEVVVDSDGSAVLDGATPPNWTYDWTTT